ncbi:MAG TPA: ABC transporter substrate-binding protein [Thermomicrobiales bacterium]|nr:ABC transporter substrate-binding protein [Thermomicrobiales bacterium]
MEPISRESSARAGRAMRRRDFLRLGGVAGLGAALAGVLGACGGPSATPTAATGGGPATVGAPRATGPSTPAAGSAAGSPGTAGAKPTGKLTVGVGALPATLDPHLNNSGVSFATYFQLYEGLTNITADGKLEPALATSWQYVDDKTLELKLRQGVVFHNGEPFDADAVKWNVERILNPQTKSVVKSRIPTVDHVEVLDPATVRLVLSAPAALLVKALSVVFMIPPKYFAAQGGSDGFVKKPVGTGPFMFTAGAPADYIQFAANDRYWRGQPKLAAVEYKALPEAGARLAALQSGQVDLIQNLPVINVEQIQAAGFQISEAFQSRMHVINFMIPIVPQLKDKRVRQALNYAVDKQALVTKIMRGHAKISQGQLLGEDGVGYNPNVKAYPYDVAKAKQLLADAGAANLELTCFVTDGAYIQDKDTMQAVAGMLQDAGVKVTLQPIEFSAFSQKFFANTLTGLNLQGMNYFPVEDADFVFANYLSDAVARMYANPDFDKALRASEQELDEQRRLKQLQDIDSMLYDDPPVIFLFQPPDLFGVAKNVAGFTARHDARIDLLGVTKA